MRCEGRSSCIRRTSRRSVSEYYHIVNHAAVSVPSRFQSRIINTKLWRNSNTIFSAVEVWSDMEEHGIDHHPTTGFRLKGGVRIIQCQHPSVTDLHWHDFTNVPQIFLRLFHGYIPINRVIPEFGSILLTPGFPFQWAKRDLSVDQGV